MASPFSVYTAVLMLYTFCVSTPSLLRLYSVSTLWSGWIRFILLGIREVKSKWRFLSVRARSSPLITAGNTMQDGRILRQQPKSKTITSSWNLQRTHTPPSHSRIPQQLWSCRLFTGLRNFITKRDMWYKSLKKGGGACAEKSANGVKRSRLLVKEVTFCWCDIYHMCVRPVRGTPPSGFLLSP